VIIKQQIARSMPESGNQNIAKITQRATTSCMRKLCSSLIAHHKPLPEI